MFAKGTRVQFLWSCEVPCESATLKVFFPSARMSHWNIWRYRFKSPPLYFLSLESLWRREPGVLNKVYMCRNTDQPFTFSRMVWKAALPLESLHSSPELSILSRHPRVTCAGWTRFRRRRCREWLTFRTRPLLLPSCIYWNRTQQQYLPSIFQIIPRQWCEQHRVLCSISCTCRPYRCAESSFCSFRRGSFVW